MSIIVQSPGLFTTVQDLGRLHHGILGVSRSGAADPLSLRLGNQLVGNPDTAAALEMTLLGGRFLFPNGATVAFTGAEFEASIPMWTQVKMKPGAELLIGSARTGARCYLCVSGGIKVPLFLGSASTHVLSGLGGYSGRQLRKGDCLNIGESRHQAKLHRAIRTDTLQRLTPRKTLRVTAGLQASAFSKSAGDVFYTAPYLVAADSNRMGLRLRGAQIESPDPGQMITEGVPLGAIQVPPDGQPIILFVDQQTTGGYPKLANVITADLPSVGQLRPHDEVRFQLVSAMAARQALLEQEQLLQHAMDDDCD